MVKFEEITTKIIFSGEIDGLYYGGNSIIILNDAHDKVLGVTSCQFAVKEESGEMQRVADINRVASDFTVNGDNTFNVGYINGHDLSEERLKAILDEIEFEVKEKYLEKIFSGDYASINDDIVEDSSIGD